MKKSILGIALSIMIVCLVISSCKTKTDVPALQEGPITSEYFGSLPNGDTVLLYTLKSDEAITVKITNYGGIITSIVTPDKTGEKGNIVLGFDNFEQYKDGNAYMGALIGRYAGRIANGSFEIDGETYSLGTNNGINTLHGGNIGFNLVLWDAKIIDSEYGKGLQLKYHSADMEEGFPGNLDVTVLYELIGNELKLTYEAVTDKATPVNLSGHTYFNLAQEGTILDHELQINASSYTFLDTGLIPTGEIVPIEGSPLDFRTPKAIGQDIDQLENGYDHNFVLERDSDDLMRIAILKDPKSGRVVDVFTTEPGVQFYTGNFLDGTNISGDIAFIKHFGLCLETQHFPDSPNQPTFPNTILQAGEKYFSQTMYRFKVAEPENIQ